MFTHVPWFLWPVAAVLELFTNLIEVIFRFFAAVIGFLFILAGILLSLTLIGAILGIPLVSAGLYLMFRSHF